MDQDFRQKLERNIVKYSWYKIFTKRLYLPLITIQLVNVGHVTVQELAIIVIVSSIIQGVLQMPAGYFADTYGNKRSIVLGAAISFTSPLFYVFMPDFWGGLIASVLFFGGYAFQSGSVEAFVHDTLIALDKEKQYAKVMGRAQTYGLLANVVLIALVPATYVINHALPFLLGFISLAIMLWLTVSFVHPTIEKTEVKSKNPFNAVKAIVNGENIALFLFAGFLAGVSNKGGEFRELAFQDLGVAVGLFGLILSASSLAGAVFGWYVHALDKLRPLAFYLFDFVLLSLCFIVMGLTKNALVSIGAFILFAGYTRVRMIIFQAKLLHELKHSYKATLISALNLFTLFGEIAAISMLTKFVDMRGYITGYLWFGISVLLLGFTLWLLVSVQTRRLARTA